MRFGNSYKDLELFSSQLQTRPVGAKEVKSSDSSVLCRTQTQSTFTVLSTAYFYFSCTTVHYIHILNCGN